MKNPQYQPSRHLDRRTIAAKARELGAVEEKRRAAIQRGVDQHIEASKRRERLISALIASRHFSFRRIST